MSSVDEVTCSGTIPLLPFRPVAITIEGDGVGGYLVVCGSIGSCHGCIAQLQRVGVVNLLLHVVGRYVDNGRAFPVCKANGSVTAFCEDAGSTGLSSICCRVGAFCLGTGDTDRDGSR